MDRQTAITRLRRLLTRFGEASFIQRIRPHVAIDTRSLALFRMVAGGLLVVDTLLRSRKFHFFYTDVGAVPVELAITEAPEGAFSLYFFSGEPAWTGLLFLTQIAVGILLFIGWRTRVMIVLSFLLAVSLDHRNVLVTSYADTLFRHLLFFGMFLPLGERWSIDTRQRDRPPRRTVANLASALILLQMVVMYTVTGYLKYQSPLWLSGDAVPVILAHDSITFLLGDYLAQAPTLLRYGGFVWFYLLTVSVLLVVLLGRARTALAGCFIVIHLTLAVSVRIGQFSYVAIAGLVLFLQADFWRDLTILHGAIGRPGEQLHRHIEAIAQRLTDSLPAVTPPQPRSKLIVVILLVAGADIGVAVLETTDVIGEDTVPQRAVVDDLKESFGIEQPDWSIFAPNPSTTDEWYVVAVETANGERYDLHNERPLAFRRPGTQLNNQWDTYRERFYWKELEEGDVARAYRDYLCRGGNRAVGDVAYVTVYEVTEVIDPDRPVTLGDPTTRERRIHVLYAGACGDRQPIRLGPTNGSQWE